MAYSVTSAANPKALLAAIVSFATANGWTVEFDDATGVGGIGGQIGLSSGNCHVAIGEQNATQNPVAVTSPSGPLSDGRLYMAISPSINPALQRYWGQPGSIVASATDGLRTFINDVWGPMEEVHFFGNSDYIIVSVRCSALRWTCFGFGNLDTLGMSHPKPGFCFSNYHAFWSTSGNMPIYNLNDDQNRLLFSDTSSAFRAYVPDGTLDPSLGFASGPVFVPRGDGVRHDKVKWARLGQYVESLGSGNACVLDQVLMLRNQPTTGGIALQALPVMYWDLSTNLRVFLGTIPGLRAVRMPQNSPGDTVLYGVEEYMLFPWKQKGVVADTPYLGGTPNGQPNTYDLGWAILKD